MKIWIPACINRSTVLCQLYNSTRYMGPHCNYLSPQQLRRQWELEEDKPGCIEKAQQLIDMYDKNAISVFRIVDLGGGPRPLGIDLRQEYVADAGYEGYHGPGSISLVMQKLLKEEFKCLNKVK